MKNRNPRGAFETLGYLLLFSMIFVPTTYQLVKLAVLVLLLSAVIGAWATGRVRVRQSLLLTCLGVAAVGTSYGLYGLFRNNSGALPVLTAYALWPLAFALLTAAIDRREMLDRILRTLIFGANAIGAYGCAYIFVQQGRLPSWLFNYTVDQSQIYFSPTPGVVTASFTTLAPLTFLLPFALAYAIIWPSGSPAPVRRRWAILAVVLVVALAVLSGRRSLLLVAGIAPAVILPVWWLTRHRHSVGSSRAVPVLYFGWLAAVLLYMRGFSIRPLVDRMVEGFRPDFSDDASIRSIQAEQLWDGFSDMPIFGHGLGASVDQIRDPEAPWSYELSYLALLFHVGMVGFIFYALLVGVPALRAAAKGQRSDWLAPYSATVLVGWVSFMVGNATNPYLAKFDAIWIAFLPAVLLNVFWFTEEKAREAPTRRSLAARRPVRTIRPKAILRHL